MAVKAAVVGYEEFLNPPSGESGSEDGAKPVIDDMEEEISDRELDEMDRKDLDSLLLSELVDEDDEEEEGGICAYYEPEWPRADQQCIALTSISRMLCMIIGRLFEISRLIG